MRKWFFPVTGLITALYWFLVSLGIYQDVSPWLYVVRLILVIALLALYVPIVTDLFKSKPYRDADYHITGLLLIVLSLTGFAILSEVGRAFEFPTSIAKNALAGYFVMMIAGGAFFLFMAPRIQGPRVWWAIITGIAVFLGIWVAWLANWIWTHTG